MTIGFNTLIALNDDDSFSIDFHVSPDMFADMLNDMGANVAVYILLERGGSDRCRLHYVAGDYSSDSLADHSDENQKLLKRILDQHSQRVYWRSETNERDIIGIGHPGVRKV